MRSLQKLLGHRREDRLSHGSRAEELKRKKLLHWCKKGQIENEVAIRKIFIWSNVFKIKSSFLLGSGQPFCIVTMPHTYFEVVTLRYLESRHLDHVLHAVDFVMF